MPLREVTSPAKKIIVQPPAYLFSARLLTFQQVLVYLYIPKREVKQCKHIV